jgi:sodium-dependent dicarboxylate transporter 2/3/5
MYTDIGVKGNRMKAENKGLPLSRKVGLLLGILLFLVILLIPTGDPVTQKDLSPQAKKTAAVAALMAVWWISEAIPIYVTALVPIVLFPLLGVADIRDVTSPYANHFVFLMMGGFFIAMAMQRWRLERRIALHIIRMFGANPRSLILGFMSATAFISMWISNTATTMMMMPIGLGILIQVQEGIKEQDKRYLANFGIALMLGIAYAANVGGIGTLVGTFPNGVFAGYIEENLKEMPRISFATWLKIGLPVTLCFLPIIWLYLGVVSPVRRFTSGTTEVIEAELKAMGKIKRGEIAVLIIFIMTCLLWIFRKELKLGFLTIPGWSSILPDPDSISDATVAVLAALALFLTPVDLKRGEFALNWEWAKRTPWGLLLLFGGGFALGSAFKVSGLSSWIGLRLEGIGAIHPIFYILFVSLMVTFLTEVTSNTATTQILLPIMHSVSIGLGIHPFLLMIPTTISASCAFMLPVATPPNAIVFGTGYIAIHQMAKIGLGLNIIGAVLITLLTYLFIIPSLIG